MILGLDISTAVTGVSVLDAEGNLLLLDFVDTRKFKSIFETADAIEKKLADVASMGKFDMLCIEQSLQRFRPGFSSAATLMTLAKINGIVSYVARDKLGVDPIYIDVTAARKKMGIKIEKAKTKQQRRDTRWTKRQVFSQVTAAHSQLSKISWPTTKQTKRHKSRLKDCCFDMIDAYVVSYVGFMTRTSST